MRCMRSFSASSSSVWIQPCAQGRAVWQVDGVSQCCTSQPTHVVPSHASKGCHVPEHAAHHALCGSVRGKSRGAVAPGCCVSV